MRVTELIRGRRVVSVTPETSVLEAARSMVDNEFGAVTVVDGSELVDILSERDLMTRVLACGRVASATTVAEVMTKNPHVVGPTDDVDECMFLMKEHNFRHLPVLNERSQVIGMVSMKDILWTEIEEKDREHKFMRAYVSGVRNF